MPRQIHRSKLMLPPINRPDDPFERVAERAERDATASGDLAMGRLHQLATVPDPGLTGSPGRPLDGDLRQEMERKFGHSFSRVRVHVGRESGDLVRAGGAKAFTLGHDIHFGEGAYLPASRAGRQLIAHELSHVVQQTGQAGPGGRPPAGVAQAKHLSIDEAIAAFSNKVDTRAPGETEATVPSVVETGQFYWTNQLEASIRASYQAILADASWDPSEKLALQTALDEVTSAILQRRRDTGDVTNAATRAIRASKNPLKSKLQALFWATSGLSGKEVSQLLWQNRNSKEIIPPLKRYSNFPMLMKVYSAESVACGAVADIAIRRFASHGGFTDIDPAMDRKDKTLKGKSFYVATGIKRHNDVSHEGSMDYYKGDEVLYGGSLASAVAEVRRALDAGFLVHARVVSGVGVGGDRPVLKTEHSIVIIGYDGPNLFVFWDPDANSSTMPRQGFGYLFHSQGRFGTPGDDQSFRVDAAGDHAGGGQHRYQIVSMFIR